MKKLSVLLFFCLTHCFSSSDTKKVSKNTTAEQNVATATDDENTVSEIDTHTDDSEIQIKEDTTFEDTNVYMTLEALDVKPEFHGGLNKFHKFVNENFIKPVEEPTLEGKIHITFVIEKDGSLSDIKIIKHLGFNTANEAIRVLKQCPKWIPGELNHKKIRVFKTDSIILK
ncbi:energy transducer TonB [Flavobacterium collinsii]|uniref:TonB C-terminal domain-containing protein n=1 Tax=Flavobacterium collinsii TaxID=1114861 RepID=A0ABM8KJR4_9FLAO|nr:energy transducer TonB [Flavobacterium collinsii]CAA9198467.1 hypothetical protein FLACOL7796_02225 [Flavobacterium collinsii]